MKGPYLGTELI